MVTFLCFIPNYIYEPMDTNQRHEGEKTTFIDLTRDYGFKIVMADDAHPELMMELLNEVIPEHRVVHIDFLNKEIISNFESDKRFNYDVLCVDENGNRFLVEMQKCSYDYFTDRLVAYSGAQLTHLLKRGEEYSQLRRSYIISVLGELLHLSDEDKPFSRQIMRTAYITMSDSKINLSNKLKFIFLQLPMAEKPAEGASFIAKWTYYVREMHTFREKPAGLEPYFDLLFEASRRENIESGKLSIYDKMVRDEIQIKAERDYAIKEALDDYSIRKEAEKQYAIKEALEGQREELEREMLAAQSQALEQDKLETARNFKAEGIPADVIAKCTGLTMEQVAGL